MGSTSRMNVSSHNGVPKMDGRESIFDEEQRGNPEETCAEPINPHVEETSKVKLHKGMYTSMEQFKMKFFSNMRFTAGESQNEPMTTGRGSFCPKFAGENIESHYMGVEKEKRDKSVCAEDNNATKPNTQFTPPASDLCLDGKKP
ncbi:hypothetical protein VNO77_32085 [Canavalia gladiata]|uniref:Uncharacterized protein n=1 Tax=Canavalia gladiata TaxID=3824 RepID=A0AAN9Q495_CANGL